jgi:hypothetical protein
MKAMTLKDVAAAIRNKAESEPSDGKGLCHRIDLEALEADPEFTLPERVRKLAKEFEDEPAKYFREMKHPIEPIYKEACEEFARRLLELVEVSIAPGV